MAQNAMAGRIVISSRLLDLSAGPAWWMSRSCRCRGTQVAGTKIRNHTEFMKLLVPFSIPWFA
jgi:hypothetical protein